MSVRSYGNKSNIQTRTMTSSKRNIFRVTGPLWGESGGFLSQRPMTRSFDVFFYLRLSKQSKRRWFETPSRSLWRHCNGCCCPNSRANITVIMMMPKLSSLTTSEVFTNSNSNIWTQIHNRPGSNKCFFLRPIPFIWWRYISTLILNLVLYIALWIFIPIRLRFCYTLCSMWQ